MGAFDAGAHISCFRLSWTGCPIGTTNLSCGPVASAALASRRYDGQATGKGKDMDVKQLLQRLVKEDSGQDLIEYALVAALVGLGAVSSINGLANSIENTFNGVGSALSSAVA
jgi:pilus assembly protein Flp/PilA